MLAISNLCTVPQSPSISRPFCIPKIPRFQLLYSLMASSSKIVVEYAKSNRSSCKKCAETIAKSGMRLGLVSRDSRGFDMTKWHHVDCLPFDSNSISTAVAIGGFSELKSSDQEILKKLVDGGDQSQEKVQETDEDLENKLEKRDSKKTKVQETDEGLENDLEERDSKKTKVGSFTFVVEYAKSNRSSCKKCAETIAKSAMRLGLVSRDSRGFDMTKWHHVNCLSFDSNSISTAEAIGGFSELKSSDQEILKKLVDGGDQFQEKVQETGEDLENELEERCSAQVQETGEDLENELEERDSKKTKLSAPNEGAGLELNFSISDIKNEYKDAKLLPKWKAFQTIIFLERNIDDASAIPFNRRDCLCCEDRKFQCTFPLFTDDGLNDSSKVAAFDFDGCLAKTSVKRVGPDAWSLMYPSIPEKLQSLYNDGYKLVIFTNESNIERWKNKRQVAVDSKIGRLNNFIKKVKVPIQVFIACGFGKSDGQAEDPFRKPKPGMWHFMEQHLNSGIAIDMNQSFYVGDAAGRDHDHSDADIKFAQAIGLKFYLPEEYFGPDH